MVLSSQALQIKEVHLAGLYTNQNFNPHDCSSQTQILLQWKNKQTKEKKKKQQKASEFFFSSQKNDRWIQHNSKTPNKTSQKL